MGKQSRKVEIVKYDPEWPNIFRQLSAVISKFLDGLVLRIEHVGSTSVPNLDGKATIDFDVVIPSRNLLPEIIKRLEKLGYQHRGDLDVPGREAFRRNDDQVPQDGSGRTWMSHNLYVCEQENDELARHVKFRNYLRTHPTDAHAYAQLKYELARQFPYDIDAYAEAKTSFVKEQLAKADKLSE